ncbi:hypothetical protein TNIN_93431 [Trichonephila inaurata madagascariensis]|uniref:Uncharacterized protein n=1 Tax=Trichonephila inaurata madagascariensis TaxID=2747483 RepID=A0A8X7C5E0_9ARAC|nr:hypothetical protein TNIN_93431 [Trichonephila inaurata madagascariensis]
MSASVLIPCAQTFREDNGFLSLQKNRLLYVFSSIFLQPSIDNQMEQNIREKSAIRNILLLQYPKQIHARITRNYRLKWDPLSFPIFNYYRKMLETVTV